VIFYEEYNKQTIDIIEKLKQSKKLKHQEQYDRIMDYYLDLINVKKYLDDFVFDMEIEKDNKVENKFRQRLLKTKMGRFLLVLKELNKLNQKYKKENCNIDNFPV
jgi:hypothetical protein